MVGPSVTGYVVPLLLLWLFLQNPTIVWYFASDVTVPQLLVHLFLQNPYHGGRGEGDSVIVVSVPGDFVGLAVLIESMQCGMLCAVQNHCSMGNSGVCVAVPRKYLL